MPGMPNGKAAGEWCLHLGDSLECGLFNDPRRPLVCSQLQPSPQMCGESRQHAMTFLGRLEAQTS